MAIKYVRSLAGGAATGADWANAFLTLAAAFAAMAAGDTAYVSEDHAETQASGMTLTSPGTAANPCFVYCVNHLGTVPPVSADLRTTATITTTGASSLSIAGPATYYYGIAFSAGSGAVNSNLNVNANNGWVKFMNCVIGKAGTNGSNNAIQFAGGSNDEGPLVELSNTVLKFGAAGDSVRLDGKLSWRNTPSAVQGTTPTILFGTFDPGAGEIFVEAVDLSALGAGGTICGASNNLKRITLKDCKLGAGVTVAATPPNQAASEVLLTRSNSAGTNYRAEKYSYRGTETTETTIVLTGGASDGTTPQSRKLVSTANSKWVAAFEAMPLAVWCDVAGVSKTVTVHAVSGAAGLLNNDDVWISTEYLSDAASGQGSFATSTKADNLAAGVAYTADGASWAGAPAGTPFSMSATFTPAQKGWVYVYVHVAKASATVYVDPKVVLV